MMSATHDRVARIEKLAGEAEQMTKGLGSPYAVSAWTWKNARELSTLLHDLAKRIKAEEEGAL